jgi:hypothetical protein
MPNFTAPLPLHLAAAELANGMRVSRHQVETAEACRTALQQLLQLQVSQLPIQHQLQVQAQQQVQLLQLQVAGQARTRARQTLGAWRMRHTRSKWATSGTGLQQLTLHYTEFRGMLTWNIAPFNQEWEPQT